MKNGNREGKAQIATSYHIKFFFKGFPRPVIYGVSKETSDDVSSAIRDYPNQTDGPFLGFSTTTNRAVIINSDSLVLCQVLVDYGTDEPPTDADKTDEIALSLLIDGISEPQEYVDTDENEIALIATTLEGIEPGEERFISFTDDDGEENLIKARTIIIMESIPYSVDSEEVEADYR
jgi:hypothetical protein